MIGGGVARQGCVVREPTVADAAAIAALHVRSWQAAYRGIVPDEFLDELTEDAWLERWAGALATPAEEGVHRLVSTRVQDGAVVAIANAGPALERVGPATGQLYVLYTDPSVWGEGHGGALLREVHARLAADGHAAALLWVAAANARTIAIYEHHGWRRDGAVQSEDVHGMVIEEARMILEFTT